MEEGLAARLLTSIETDRLVIFCGAGLSMAAPSSVPSARRLAEMCSIKYQEITGSPVPGEAKEDLKRLAEFFHAQGNFHSLFLQCLIPWYLFRQHPRVRVSCLRAALKAAYLAGESPAPGIAYLPG